MKQKILLTGATGYVGRRLKLRLLNDPDVELTLLVRHKASLASKTLRECKVVEGDSFNLDALREALRDIDIAYYLIHSLGNDDFVQKDRISAENFRKIAIECGVRKVIYLGGLGNKNKTTSSHLSSRIETGEILSQEPQNLDVIWFRAGVVIGSGSTSFEIIRNLIEKLPIMTTPKWVRTKAQSIGIDDVVRYLEAAKTSTIQGSHVVDIGSDLLSYEEMMRKCATYMGLKRLIVPVPFLSVGLSSYWLGLFTPVAFGVARSLIKGLGSEVIVENDAATQLFAHIKPASFEQSVKKALQEVEENQVISRWSDNGNGVWETNHKDSIANALFIDRQIIPLNELSATDVFEEVISIGGAKGWFTYDWLWEIRGMIDTLMGGVGLNRGRRSQKELRLGDSLDFWKVVDIQENERLLLYAQMKVPGKAWLEFKIEDNQLIQSAYFLPRGVLGRIYWYGLIPIHYFVFKDMIQSIIKRVKSKNQ